MALIELNCVSKTYVLGSTEVHALREVSLKIEQGEFIAVWGPSGSGKSSLLNVIGLIDTPSSGEVLLAQHRINELSDDALAELRNEKIGFIFQSFNLIPVLSALENVMLPLQLRGVSERQARDKARARLVEVGLEPRMHARPDEMSGGQRQRVAMARALVGDPELVLADEPTANLDTETSYHMVELMRKLNEDDRVTFVFATHDNRLLDHVKRKIHLVDGRIGAEGEA
ncbi:MAG: ABC transporter ATP-binding protein [Pseudomonadota bacterium]|nr:ABC transporter ATP-binding protein [Pseudomonadota bacterium]